MARCPVDSEKRNRLWHYGLLLLALLPVLMVAGSCPDLSGTTAVGAEAVAWFCRLLV
jgi:hypothetical protein